MSKCKARLEVGQVVWLKLRFNINGEYSEKEHPYIIEEINNDINSISIIQLDSLAGKEHYALKDENHIIFNYDPEETVISRDSYAQLDRITWIEYFDELMSYRKSNDKLSEKKLEELIKRHKNFIIDNEIDSSRIIHYSKEDILSHNQTKSGGIK